MSVPVYHPDIEVRLIKVVNRIEAQNMKIIIINGQPFVQTIGNGNQRTISADRFLTDMHIMHDALAVELERARRAHSAAQDTLRAGLVASHNDLSAAREQVSKTLTIIDDIKHQMHENRQTDKTTREALIATAARGIIETANKNLADTLKPFDMTRFA